MTSPRTPRQLLGWTVPEHMQVVSPTNGSHHLTCRHLVHVGGFPGRILSPHDEDLPTLVGHWFRDHAHGETVEYHPKITGYPSSAIGSEPDLPLMSERRVPVSRAVAKQYHPLSEVPPETPEPPREGCCGACSGNGHVQGEACPDCLGSGHTHDPDDPCPAPEPSPEGSYFDRTSFADEEAEAVRAALVPVPASQSVPAVPVSSTGGKETGEAAEGGTEELKALPGSVADANEKWTERRVLDLLGERYGNQPWRYGNGGIRYATAEHVRSHAGFDARRTADFVAMDLWTSSGLALHGHEVKVSRSDWLAELKQPEKAAEFTPYMTFWWLVVSDRSIVRDGELPDGWGLMAPRGGQLAVVTKAKRRAPEPLPRTMLASLLRAVMKTAVARTKALSGEALRDVEERDDAAGDLP